MLEERGVTLVGISVANLDDALPRQLALALEGRNTADLDEAIDVVRERFGSKAITRGVLVGRAEGSRCRCCRTNGTGGSLPTR